MADLGPKVSVVICAYTLDRLKDVREAVASALIQTLPPHQVIVSVDHNRELLERLKTELPASVALVSNDSIKGLSETRNAGIRTSTGDIIAFMDDDAVAEKDWLEKLSRHFQNGAVAAVGGKIIPQWMDGTRPAWFPEELDWIIGCTYAGLPLRGNLVRNLIGCNMAFRAGVFNSVGLFNTAVGRTSKTQGIGEDSELCLRLTRLVPGALIIYEPESVVHHKVPPWRVNPGYLFRRSYDEGYHKNTVQRLSSGSSVPLSTENRYLRYLLLTSIPRRLKRMYRWQELLQVGAISLCVAAVGLGYSKGRIKHWIQRPGSRKSNEPPAPSF
ncbi:MAG: glycosyltransferase family 2 protein [Dehalococcoidales bacterium]|nr:glycosyltransferase family 2 protein [Dehalococcoidales bacterium]